MQIVQSDQAAIDLALNFLRQKKLVALPTETVYGLAGDATESEAVAAIYQVKGRPQFNPLIAHVAEIAMAEEICYLDDLSRSLMEKFWPGPLTLVLPLKPHHPIDPLATAGLLTVALRQPQGVFNDIVRKFGKPLVAPSANRSGKLSPTTAQAVADDLKDAVPLMIDGGPSGVGIESTIIKIIGDEIFLLRPGGLPNDALEAALGKALTPLNHSAAIEAPGMMSSHYAPNAVVRMNAISVREDEALLAFGKQHTLGVDRCAQILNLSLSGDTFEAAAHLFAYLKKLDQTGVKQIAVQPIPLIGLGLAINDRLQRASAKR